MPMTRVLITEPVSTKQEFFEALGAIRQAAGAPAPRNLDAMVDFLREHDVHYIFCADWQLGEEDTQVIAQILSNEEILFRL